MWRRVWFEIVLTCFILVTEVAGTSETLISDVTELILVTVVDGCVLGLWFRTVCKNLKVFRRNLLRHQCRSGSNLVRNLGTVLPDCASSHRRRTVLNDIQREYGWIFQLDILYHFRVTVLYSESPAVFKSNFRSGDQSRRLYSNGIRVFYECAGCA